MRAHHTAQLLNELPRLAISPQTSEEEAERSMRLLEAFNECTLGAVRFSGETPWERHPDGDELLYVLDGEVTVTLLTERDRSDSTLGVGSVCVVPRGLWHRQRADAGAAVLFATPTEGTESSWAEDPRPG